MLFDIIGGAKLKKHYVYAYEINEVGGNDLHRSHCAQGLSILPNQNLL